LENGDAAGRERLAISDHREAEVAQEKMPTETMLTPASRIARTSSSHTARGRCSGS
jgi:hypothetical protein